MTKPQNFLRVAQLHERIGSVLGWLWILGSLVGIGWIVAAIVGDASWFIGIAVFLGAQFTKALAREYNRAAQKAIADGVTAGDIGIDAGAQAHPVNSGERVSSRAAIENAFSWADDVVGRYAALLERQTGSPYFPEGALPASKDEVKQALLVVATVRRGTGHISDGDLHIYKAAYTRLIYATPDERATALDRSMTSVKTVGGVANLPNAQLRDVVRGVASAYEAQGVDQDQREAAALPAEFDARLASLLAIYRRGAT